MLKNLLSSHFAPEMRSKDILFQILNYLIPILVGTYVLVNPLPFASINEICFYVSVIALITLLIFRKTDFTLRSPMTLPFALFFLWAVFGLFFALDIENTVHDLRSHLLNYLIVYYLLVNFFPEKRHLEILSLILIASATLFSIGGVIQYYFIEGHAFTERMGFTYRKMHTGFIGFITIFGAILSVRHFHLYKSVAYKILFAACFLINVIVTILTQTRSTLIGLVAALVLLCFANKKNTVLILVLILILVFVPGMKTRIQDQGFSKDIRNQMYRLSIEVIKDHPIVGIGFGIQTYGKKDLVPLEKYNLELPRQYQQHGIIINSPHSTYLDIAIRTGLVGLSLFIYLLLTAAGMLWLIFKRSKKDEYLRSWSIYLFTGLMSYLLPAAFVDTTYGPRVIIFYTILAMITIVWNLSRKDQPASLNA